MRHRRPVAGKPDHAPLARYAHDLTRTRLLLDAQIRRGDVAAVHVAAWLFGTDTLTQETAA